MEKRPYVFLKSFQSPTDAAEEETTTMKSDNQRCERCIGEMIRCIQTNKNIFDILIVILDAEEDDDQLKWQITISY